MKYDCIPGELQARRQWVVWKSILTKKGTLAKIPYRAAAPKYKADTTRPDTWGTFKQALAALSYPDVAGIGYVFTKDDPFVGVDFDHCVTCDVIDQTVKTWLESFDSYSEFSQSGGGIHIIVAAALPDGRRKVGNLEIYDNVRFFAMTGDHVPGTPTTITPAQDAVDAFLSHLNTLQPETPATKPAATPPATPTPLDLADNELLAVMFASKNGEKWQRLWNGDATGYRSTSEADLALAGALSFYCGGDVARIESLMLASGLNRPKFPAKHGESTYLRRTVDRAVKGCKKFYTPSRADVVWAKLKALREFVETYDWAQCGRRSETMQRCAINIVKRFEVEHSTETYFSISQIATMAGVGPKAATTAINGNVNQRTGEISPGLMDILPIVRIAKSDGFLASCYAISEQVFAREMGSHTSISNTSLCVNTDCVATHYSRKCASKIVESNLSEDAFQRGGTKHTEGVAKLEKGQGMDRVDELSRLFNAEVKVNEPAKSFSNLSLSIVAYLDATQTKSARLSEIAETLGKHPATVRSAIQRMTDGLRLYGCEPIVETETLRERGNPIIVILPDDWQDRVNLARPYLASYGKHEQRLQGVAFKRLKRLETIAGMARRPDTKQMIEEIANRQRSIFAYADGDLQRVDELLNRVESHIIQHEPEAAKALTEEDTAPAPDWSQLDWTGEAQPVEVATKPATKPSVKPAVAPVPVVAPLVVTITVTERLHLGSMADEKFGTREYL